MRFTDRLFINTSCWIIVALLGISTPAPTHALFWPFTGDDDLKGQSNTQKLSDEPNSSGSQQTNIQVAGYLPDYRLKGINLNDTVTQLDDLILFSVEAHSRGMVGGCCLGREHFEAATVAKENFNPNLRLWVTVGGAGRTSASNAICQNPEKRYKFMQSMIRLCKREGIQGIDLDWMSAVQTEQDMDNYLIFLKEAIKVWHFEGLLVSLPIHVQQYLPMWVYNSVDRINLMVYDTPPLPDGTVEELGNHAIRIGNSHHALRFLLEESGCPAFKVWLGIPFYGTQWNSPGKIQTYAEVADRLIGEKNPSIDAVRFTKDLEEAFEGYQWDSPSVIREKIRHAHKRDLGGVFVWEVGQDFQTFDSPGGLMLMVISHMSKSNTWDLNIQDNGDDGDKSAKTEL